MKITIETNIAAPIADVWRAFNNPNAILQWDASDDWYTTWASNDLKIGGKLLQRMETTNGGKGFDVAATYTQIEPSQLIEFRMDDGCIVDRMVRLEFIETDTGVTIRQTFDAELKYPEDQQRLEWQSILDRFARYAERQIGAA